MRASIPAACLLAVLTLFGCEDTPQAGSQSSGGGSDEETTSTPSPETEEPTTEGAEATAPPPPEMPAEASEDSEAGAEAFVRYYIDLLSHGYIHKEVDALRSHTLESCEICLEYADAYAETGEKGGEIVSGDATWQIGDLFVVEHKPGESARVGVNITIGEHTFAESGDATHVTRPESRHIFSFILSRQEDLWAIEQMTQA